jgi:hypothetical protein
MRSQGVGMLLIVLGLLPLLLLGATGWFYRREGGSLLRWRKALFLIGVLANTVSAAVLASFLVHAYVASRGSKSVDLDGMYPVFSMMGLALLAAVLAFFGRRVSRPILVVGGLITIIAWYLAALGASP